MKHCLAVILGCFFLSTNAHAHFYAEPDLGFEFGTTKQTFVSSNSPALSSSYNNNGVTYGLGAGYRYNLAYLGAQYEKCLAGHVTDISAIVGYNIAIKVRLWAGYIFSTKDDVSSGSGYKLGLGVAVWRLVGINGEYAARTYNKYSGPSAYTGLNYSGTTNTFKLTISLPSPRPL